MYANAKSDHVGRAPGPRRIGRDRMELF
jgi:hypothetical protein